MPANCSPATIRAWGSESSFSMHSVTTRRAIRLVDATRGMIASDSSVLSFATTWAVSIIELLVLLQFLDASAELGVSGLRLFHDRGGRIAHELLVRQFCFHRGQLLAGLLDLTLGALDLLLSHDSLRELDADGETFHHIVVHAGRRLAVDHHFAQPRQFHEQVGVFAEEVSLARNIGEDIQLEALFRSEAALG